MHTDFMIHNMYIHVRWLYSTKKRTQIQEYQIIEELGLVFLTEHRHPVLPALRRCMYIHVRKAYVRVENSSILDTVCITPPSLAIAEGIKPYCCNAYTIANVSTHV